MSAALPQTLPDWLALLEARHAAAPIQLGLDRVRAVWQRLAGAPALPPIFTVGGTNGKGSTCAMLETILRAAGHHVAGYSSPHLLDYTERVRIDGTPADPQALAQSYAAVETARQDTPLTYFEHGTLAAWHYFLHPPAGTPTPEAWVLEAGMGGRLDAVNILDADCAIVTTVDLDHTAFLGPNREAIGMEKAGIFRAGRPAVCGDPNPPASLLHHARELGTQLWRIGQDFGFENEGVQWRYWRRTALGDSALTRRGGLAHPALRGSHQLLNAAVALTALDTLRDRLPCPMQAVRQGLMQLDLPGRFQTLPGRPTIILDVAHNPQAAHTLTHNLGQVFYPHTRAVLGMLADKDIAGVIRTIAPRIDHWHLAPLPGSRGQSAEALAEIVRAEAGDVVPIETADSVAAALAAARQAIGENDRIVVFGSFLTVAEALHALRH